ncbi:MAG TPA: glycosyltransferase family 4 protein [Candidatus Acidoferrum sp.]|nr:glycosyltransferase family 4 protein [Candidatus Acidoferrum sp.]
MKSVCILLHNHYETDVRVTRKAEALISAGYDVDLLALRSKYSKSKNYDLGGVHVHTISLGKKRGSLVRYAFEYLMFFVWASYKVFSLHRKKKYAVIDVNNLPDFLVFAGAYAKWTGAKIVFDMHEITPEFYISKYGIKPDSFVVRLLKYIERKSFNFADYVININQTIEDVLVNRGLLRSKSTIIMNCVDEEFFLASKPSESGAGAEIPQPKFVMMYHGTVTHIYGLDIALQGFAKVHQDMPGAEFWILGTGTEMKALESLAAELGVTSKVRFLGLVRPQEIPNWMRRCDVGVLATRQDIFLDLSFSGKLSEYIIMGKAVIASRLKTIRHYFAEDALGYFEPHNPADLAKQMIGLYRDPARRRQMAERALQEYEPIRWKVMKDRYLQLMDEATGASSALPEKGTAAPSAMAEAVSVNDSGNRK